MKNKEKNLFIGVLILISFVFLWTFSSYFKMKNNQSENQKKQTELENLKLKEQEEVLNSIDYIKLVDFKKAVFSSKPPLIVDLRGNQFYQKSHIINSILLENLDLNKSSQEVVLIAEKGVDQNVVSVFQKLSEKNKFKVLEGGFEAWLNSGGMTLSLGDPTSPVDKAKISFVEPRDVNKIWIESASSVLIIDVRRAGNFEASHIPGAINIPILDLEKKYREIPSKTNFFVYGADEISSFSAGVILYDLGFFNVKTINGGFSAWEKYGYPVEKK